MQVYNVIVTNSPECILRTIVFTLNIFDLPRHSVHYAEFSLVLIRMHIQLETYNKLSDC